MVTVDSKGRIVLPKEGRDRLGITPGTEVEVHEEAGKAVVEPEDDPEAIIERLERLVEETSASRGETTASEVASIQSPESIETPCDKAQRRRAMSDAGGPYLFDVGVIALAHTRAPVRDAALSYVRGAIAGDIEAVVPYPALLVAH